MPSITSRTSHSIDEATGPGRADASCRGTTMRGWIACVVLALALIGAGTPAEADAARPYNDDFPGERWEVDHGFSTQGTNVEATGQPGERSGPSKAVPRR